ncbi:MAG: lysostaphin resistance A-like protein [Acetanaerobacterium sp.]
MSKLLVFVQRIWVHDTKIGSVTALGTLSPKKIIIICWALIAEELGWRGFLQEKLYAYFSDFTSPLIAGVIWAAWHYHYFISGSKTVPIILFALGCVTDSYVYYALTKLVKGNTIPATIFHFSGNLCFSLFLINPEYNHGSIVPYLLFVVSSFIAAVIVTALTHKCRARVLV